MVQVRAVHSGLYNTMYTDITGCAYRAGLHNLIGYHREEGRGGEGVVNASRNLMRPAEGRACVA